MNKKIFIIAILFTMIFGKAFGAVSLIIKQHQAQNGAQVTVPIRVKDFAAIISTQGTIQFDPSVITFASVQDFGLAGMTAANFGTTLVSSGKLTFSWFDNTLSGVSLTDSTIIFSIRFNVIGNAGQQSTIGFINSPTPIETVNTNYQTVATTPVNGSVLVNNTAAQGTVTLYADTITGNSGTQVPISVRGINFTNINSIQGTIEFDPAVVTYQSINYFGLPGMNSSNFGITQVASGKITFSWNDATLSGIDKSNGDPFFTILFSLSGSNGSQTSISFVNTPTTVEITDSLFNTLSTTLTSGRIRISGTTSSQFSIKADSTSGPNGSQVVVPIRAWKFNQILSAQGTLQFNPSVVTYAGVEQFGLSGMDAGSFGTSQTSSGKLMYSWSDATLVGQTVADSTVLFAVRFNVIGSSGDYSSIDFVSTPTALECTDISYTTLVANYRSGNVEVTGPSSISLQNPSILSYCSGDAISVSYTKSGIYNSGNSFILQLSDASGSFASPVNIATINGTVSGTFNTTIPALTPNGSHYRLRVISTNPVIIGTSNSLDITISLIPRQAAKPSGSITLCQDAANTTFTTTGATNATGYIWSISPASAGSITGTTTSGIVDWNSTFSGTAYIKVLGTNNSCTGLISDSLAVSVLINPLAPAKPIGDTLLCTNPSNSTYTIPAVANATSYTWSLTPAGAGSISGTGTSATVNWDNAYTGSASIDVFASNGSCSGTISPARSVTILATPTAPAIPAGITTVCQDAADAQYKINKVANATSYSWSISPTAAGTISGTDTIATVNWNATYSGIATISVSAQNQICGSASSPSLSVNVLPYPATPATPSGSINLCVNPANTTYSITSVANATSYNWTLLPAGAGTLTPSGTSAVVDWNDTWTGVATIGVSASNGSCASSASPALSVTVHALPVAPTQPTGAILLCQNAANSSYTVSPVANATSYEWAITPSTAATLSGTGTSVIADWNASYSGTATLHVRGINNSCAGDWSADLSIDILPIPSQAALPTGSTDLCQDPANQNYTTSAASGATSYQWNIWPTTAGTITGTTTSAMVDWNSTFTGTAYIKVMGKNSSCDGSFSDSLAVVIRAYPVAPIKPAGDTLLCTNPANSTYTIPAVANATSYTWSLTPAGAGSISGTGTSATVNWDNAYTGSASIDVFASNGSCAGATSPARSVTILATPNAPAIPAGITTVCQDAADAQYKINKVANATSYSWSISPTAAGTISGTDTIGTVNWNATYSGIATISVSAQNQICSSASSPSLSVNVLPYPATPATPSGSINLCVNPASTTYSIASVANATSYNWTLLPAGAGTLTPSGTSAVVDWNDSWIGVATIGVSASNGSCASSASPALSVTVRALPVAPAQPTGAILLCQNAANSSYTISPVANATSYEWAITPSTAATLSGTGTSVVADWNASYSGTATLHVRGLNNSCAGDWSADLSIDILPIPSQAALPAGSTDLCQDPANQNYTTSAASGATSYQWNIWPTTAGTITGTTTSAMVDWNSTFSDTAYIKVMGKNSSCDGSFSDSLAVVIRAYPVAPIKPAGDTLLCTNPANSTYTIPAVANATSYTWSLTPAGAGSISGTGTSATVNWDNAYTGSASIDVFASNGSCAGATSPARSVTILATPNAPAIPAGTTTVCQDAADAQYTINKVTNATSYSWSISPTAAGTISGTDTIATVNWNATYSGVATISVSAQNQICGSASSPSLSVNVLPYPVAPATPSGNIDLCVNPSNTTYSIVSVANATSYNWTLLPAGAGTLTPSGTSAVVDWNDTWTGVATINVSASNGSCASSASPALSVTVRALPVAPAQPTGAILLCQNAANSSYTVSPVANATSYEWAITPSTAATLSGTGTSVVADWNASYSGTATLHVRGLNNSCAGDWSADLSIDITPTPLKPIKPMGDSVLCVNSSNSEYFTHKLISAESYLWQLIPSAAGTISSSDTTATVNWSDSFTGIAKIVVAGQNNCGPGLTSDTLTIIINDVPSLLPPTGLTDVCQNVLSTNCTVAVGSNANSYEWMLNPPAAGSITGISTTDAQINWTAGWSGTAYISVRGLNGCGSGQWSDSLTIIKHPSVTVPIITQTGNTLNSSALNGNQWYLGGNIIPGETNSTLVNPQNGSYTVIVTDQFGCTATSAPFIVDDVSVSEYNREETVTIAPNPNNGHFELFFTNQKADAILEIYNALGMLIYQQNIESEKQSHSLELNLPKGIYYLKLSDHRSLVKKLVIE